MERKSELLYGVAEKPPVVVCFWSAAQLLMLVATNFIYPVLLLRSTGASAAIITSTVSVSFCLLASVAF